MLKAESRRMSKRGAPPQAEQGTSRRETDVANPSDDATMPTMTGDDLNISQAEVDRLDWEENQAGGRHGARGLDFLILAGSVLLLVTLLTVLVLWRTHR